MRINHIKPYCVYFTDNFDIAAEPFGDSPVDDPGTGFPFDGPEDGADGDTDEVSGDGTHDNPDEEYLTNEDVLAHFRQGQLGNVSFTSREDMLPVEQIYDQGNLDTLYTDPFGVYALHHNSINAIHVSDFIPKPEFGETISNSEITDFCNQIFDALGLKHIPVHISTSVPNAAYAPGFFSRFTFDDGIYLNPEYAEQCISELGSSDIVISDLAHEIGHYLTQMTIGSQETHLSEKIADFVSGFVNYKMGVDVDVARKWFQWQYDAVGYMGYPVSEHRWDIEAAGYYFAQHASWDDLVNSMHDKHFVDLIGRFNSDNAEQLAQLERFNLNKAGTTQAKDILSALGMDKRRAVRMLAAVLNSLKIK